MKYIFCPSCGEKLIEKEIGDEGFVPFCLSCNKPVFEVFNVCIITAVLNEFDEIALIKQEYVSSINFVCVAGYIKPHENAEETALREVQEELGIVPIWSKYIKSYFYEKRDMLMLGFLTRVKKSDFNLSDEVDSAEWFEYKDALAMLRDGSIAKQLVIEIFIDV